MSFADVARASAEAAKAAVLDDRSEIVTENIVGILRERAAITRDDNQKASGP